MYQNPSIIATAMMTTAATTIGITIVIVEAPLDPFRGAGVFSIGLSVLLFVGVDRFFILATTRKKRNMTCINR